MKRFYLCLSFAFVLWFLIFLLIFPHTVVSIEGDDLFLLNGDFFSQVLSRNCGLSSLFLDFISQFYSVVWVGALLTALLLTLPVYFLYSTAITSGRKALGWLSFFPSQFILYFTFPQLEPLVRFFFFTLLVRLFFLIKKRSWRLVYAAILIVPVFSLFTWYESILLYVVLIIGEFSVYKDFKGCAGILIITVISLFVPKIWSDLISFVPFDSRPGFHMGGDFSLKVFSLYFMPAALLLIPESVEVKGWIRYVGIFLSVFSFSILLIFSPTLQFEENTAKISDLADRKEWEEIISEIPYDKAVKSRILTSYVLLAMNATGTMGDNLFAYPINSPDFFLFRHEERPYLVNFNRQFYDNIGIWSECFHMAFEYGILQRENDCFKSLRWKIDYSIKTGDYDTASFYLNILSKSCMNGEFVESRNKMVAMKQGKDKTYDNIPYTSDTFVGAYPLASEMFRLFERKKDNKKIMDYVLCSLLLNKEVDKFVIVLQNFNFYKNDRMPRNYSEALAAYAQKYNNSRGIVYDTSVNDLYVDFLQKLNAKQDLSEYATTYWAYLYFRQKGEAPQSQN